VDLDSIFFMRTTAGDASHADPAVTMSPSFRRMLRLLDGTRSLADLGPLFPHLDAADLRMWISELLRQKMIKRAPTLTRSQRLRLQLQENAPSKEIQVQKIAEQIRPWLAAKDIESSGPRPRPAQLARTARLAAIEASTAAVSMGREGFFVSPEPRVARAPASGVILVVEDDEIQAKIIAKILEKDGHQVRVAHNGEQALATLREKPAAQLMLLDVELPDMDGFAVLEQLRATRGLKGMRVVMLTGQADRASIAKGVVLGADGYITKPFRPQMLREAVQRLLPGA
jgi:CheY-like chemotaxis protein